MPSPISSPYTFIMALSIDDDTSSVPSTSYSLASQLQQASVSNSDTTEDPNSYNGISWDRLLGYQIPHHTKYSRRSWIHDHGYIIEETKSGKRYCIGFADFATRQYL